jgi:hypothetical protein
LKQSQTNKTVISSGAMNLKYRKPMTAVNKSTDSFDDSKIKKRDLSNVSIERETDISKDRDSKKKRMDSVLQRSP